MTCTIGRKDRVFMMAWHTTAPPTAGNLYRYQNKRLARGAVRNYLKTKRIARGKKGKTNKTRIAEKN